MPAAAISDILQFVAACALSHPVVTSIAKTMPEIVEQVRAHADQESGSHPLWLHVNRDRARGLSEETIRPSSEAEAVNRLAHLVAAGRSVDVGLMGINLRAHPDAFGTLADAFNPEINLCVGAVILGEDYRTARAADCLYNSGRMDCPKGYPEAIAARVRGGLRTTTVAAVSEKPARPPSAQVSDPEVPVWDIFGQARLARNAER